MKSPKLSDVLGIINKIAPAFLAEDWDNPGLQVGDPLAEISRIMVALDATPAVVESAINSSCQLLVTHHPLIFKARKQISAATPLGKLLYASIKGGLAVVSLHTNYDIAPAGLNDLLAERIGLEGAVPLQITASQELLKLVVFVPEGHFEGVRSAMLPHCERLGDYSDCTFAVAGEGTFTPLAGANPLIGSLNRFEQVAERRLELLVERSRLPRVVKALLAAHPYEEPAFDVYPLLNDGAKFGLGRIGRFAEKRSLAELATMIRERLAATNLRYVGDPAAMIGKIAVCSGSGASLMQSAVRAGADLLVTGDVRYHDAREAEELGIALIDAGHFATEIIMAEAISARLSDMLIEAGYAPCEVMVAGVEVDPFRYF